MFNGVKFRRYPDAETRTERVYWTPGQADRKRGVRRLHEEVWIAAHGPIRKGWHVHHRDDDPLNNDLANLELLSPKAHADRHRTPERTEARRRHMRDVVNPASRRWHGTPEGREWHRRQAAAAGFGVPVYEPHACEHCGAEYERGKGHGRFCSNNCKSAARRASGVDNEQRTCVVCAAPFDVNRYSKARSCSTACGARAASATKRGLQPDGVR